MTVREAMDDHGAPAPTRRGAVLRRVPTSADVALASRNLWRRPARTLLTVLLLGVSGGAAITGLNTSLGWDALVRDGIDSRAYDAEVRFAAPVSADEVLGIARTVPGLDIVEAWQATPAAVHRDGLDLSHVYPDDSHGSLTLVASPVDSPFNTPPLVAGRRLAADDTDAVVLSTLAIAQQLPGTEVGDRIQLSAAGRATTLQVVGIVQEFGTQGTAFITPTGFTTATGYAADRVGLLRISGDDHTTAGRNALIDAVSNALDAAHQPVTRAFTVDTLEAALQGHVYVLIETMVIVAALIGLIGLIGLGTALATSVSERTREYAILRTIGADDGFVRGSVVIEAILIALAGLGLAVVLALPATAGFGQAIGRSAFGQPLPFTFSLAPVLLAATGALAGATLASLAAAARAVGLSIREAIVAT